MVLVLEVLMVAPIANLPPLLSALSDSQALSWHNV